DGVILRSQANLIAARAAKWSAAERETVRSVLDRIAAQTRARAFREVRTRFARCDDALIAEAKQRFGVETPFGAPTSSGMLTLHCPPNHVHALATLLRDKGAENVVVADLGYVFSRADPLYAKLEAGLWPPFPRPAMFDNRRPIRGRRLLSQRGEVDRLLAIERAVTPRQGVFEAGRTIEKHGPPLAAKSALRGTFVELPRGFWRR